MATTITSASEAIAKQQLFKYELALLDSQYQTARDNYEGATHSMPDGSKSEAAETLKAEMDAIITKRNAVSAKYIEHENAIYTFLIS